MAPEPAVWGAHGVLVGMRIPGSELRNFQFPI